MLSCVCLLLCTLPNDWTSWTDASGYINCRGFSEVFEQVSDDLKQVMLQVSFFPQSQAGVSEKCWR